MNQIVIYAQWRSLEYFFISHSNEDKSFEAHIYLSKLEAANLVKGNRNVVRLLGNEAKGLMSLIIDEPEAFHKLFDQYGATVNFETLWYFWEPMPVTLFACHMNESSHEVRCFPQVIGLHLGVSLWRFGNYKTNSEAKACCNLAWNGTSYYAVKSRACRQYFYAFISLPMQNMSG